MSKTRTRRRPARWMGGPGWSAVPSHTAKTLLPPGVWHTDDRSAQLLTSGTPTITTATHASGAHFRLARVHGRLAALEAEDQAGAALLIQECPADPLGWAALQDWQDLAAS